MECKAPVGDSSNHVKNKCGKTPAREARMEDGTKHIVCPIHGYTWGDFNPWSVNPAYWPEEIDCSDKDLILSRMKKSYSRAGEYTLTEKDVEKIGKSKLSKKLGTNLEGLSTEEIINEVDHEEAVKAIHTVIVSDVFDVDVTLDEI